MNTNVGYNYSDAENTENSHCGLINNKSDKKNK